MTRRTKPYNPAAPVHDRRAADTGRKAQPSPVVVDDPLALEPGDKIEVTRNLRDDPLARLHSKGVIDQAQFDAARAFQDDWEIAERGPRAIDPGKEAVDGGRMPEPVTDEQIAAVKRLSRVDRALGLDGSALTRDILIKRKSYQQIAERRRLYGHSWNDYFGLRFRECLGRMTTVYGSANRSYIEANQHNIRPPDESKGKPRP
jgi:hypothetical protein